MKSNDDMLRSLSRMAEEYDRLVSPLTKQLEIYAAIFCLEYKKHPQELSIELRIYQSGEVQKHFPDSTDIQQIMNLIVQFDRIIEKEKLKG